MTKTISTKDFSHADFKQFVIDHLSNCNSVELTILKGHILIEYMLNHFIDKVTEEKVDFESNRFSFSQKIYLAELLGIKSKEINDQINLVNKLRNDIAHRLTYNKQHLGTLLSNIGKKYPTIIELKKSQNITIATVGAMTWICANIYAQIESQVKRRNITKDLINANKK